jgi:dolichol-phosphate mannosyltransferase
MDRPDFTFVIPVYNEESVLPELQRRLTPVIDALDGESEVLLINDGSRDASWRLLVEMHERDPRFKAIDLSRNFGHQIAVTAGLDLSQGRAVIILDADLQDPPEVVFQLVERWREGYDVVYAVREDREGETRFKRATAAGFYRVLRRLTQVDVPQNVGDFRLVDRKAVDAVKQLRENSRYLRGMFSWVGFNQIGVPYQRPARYAGETKYPLRKMVKFAADGIVSFSNVPLQMALNLGFITSALAFLGGFTAIVAKLFTDYAVPGWASIVVVLLFLGGMQLMVIGVMGEYVGRIYEEVRQRPLYIVHAARGIDLEDRVERALVPAQQHLGRAAVQPGADD